MCCNSAIRSESPAIGEALPAPSKPTTTFCLGARQQTVTLHDSRPGAARRDAYEHAKTNKCTEGEAIPRIAHHSVSACGSQHATCRGECCPKPCPIPRDAHPYDNANFQRSARRVYRCHSVADDSYLHTRMEPLVIDSPSSAATPCHCHPVGGVWCCACAAPVPHNVLITYTWESLEGARQKPRRSGGLVQS